MNSVKIQQHKYILLCTILLCEFSLFFLTSLTFFLGWEFTTNRFYIYFAIIVGELILLSVLYLIIVKLIKTYYIISPSGIKMFKRDKEIWNLSIQNIDNLIYINYINIFMLQFGSGFLNVYFSGNNEEIKSACKLPNGEKIYSISMSPKQAKAVSQLLGKSLQ